MAGRPHPSSCSDGQTSWAVADCRSGRCKQARPSSSRASCPWGRDGQGLWPSGGLENRNICNVWISTQGNMQYFRALARGCHDRGSAMQLKSPFGFSCPHCRAEGQGFSIFRSLEKTTRTSCSSCGVALESRFCGIKYVLFLLYTQIAAAPVGIFLITGALTGRWLWVGGALLASTLFVWVPPMFLHSRNVTVKIAVERPLRYGRKPRPEQ